MNNGSTEFRECCGKRTVCMDSRKTSGGTRRVWKCRVCDKHFTTIEVLATGGKSSIPIIERAIPGLPNLTERQRKLLDDLIRGFPQQSK
jgi:hypothetical protein